MARTDAQSREENNDGEGKKEWKGSQEKDIYWRDAYA